MESFIGVILILAIAISIPIAFGKIGSNIAKNNGANASSGFWFGFWLGPIGLVIAALLKPTSQSENIETIPLFSGPESLDNDSYKIWLVRTYRIEKNDAMDSFICDDRIFPSFEEAIQHAHSIEQSEWTVGTEIQGDDFRANTEHSNRTIENDQSDLASSSKSYSQYAGIENIPFKELISLGLPSRKVFLFYSAIAVVVLIAAVAFWRLSPTPAEQCQKRSLEQTQSCLRGAGSVEGIMACYNASNARQERCGKTRAQIRAEGPVEEGSIMAPAAPLVAPARGTGDVTGLGLDSSRPVDEAQPTSPDAAAGTLVASSNVRSTGVITPSDSWLLGWWSVDGYCEGDAGQTFAAQGRWGEWSVDGEWRLSGDRLTVTKLKRMFDTASGGPEPISPAEILQGRMTNIQSNSFEWMGRRMVRCD